MPASSEESKVMSISIRYGVLFINNLNKWLYNRAHFNQLLVQVKRSADLALASADTTICATVPENIMEQNYKLLVWLNETFKMQSFSL
jgi:hypothetical protein